MIVNIKLADEVLLIFQELYNIKYPIEGMSINANYEESIKANNTAGFYNNDSLVDANAEEDQKLHITGQAIDINPQINPNIISDHEYLPDNSEKYVTERKEQEGWQDIEKEACITNDSRIVSIFEKYGWEWKANGSYSGDTGHFEKKDLNNVQTITGSITDHNPDDEETDESEDTENTTNNNTNSDSGNNTTDTESEDTENEQKRQEVKDYIEDYASMRGKWSVYAKALNSGVEIVDYDKDAKMQSASVIKLFVMATVYDQRQEGNSNAQNISDSTISSMITVSDNDATNSIITQLGGGSESAGLQIINQYIQEHGYTNTEINRLMLRDTSNGDNYTSSADVAKILEEIYNGTCVSQSASEAMLGYLKNQQRKNKIPAGVPGSVETANKTGELDDVQNDAAIIFKDGAPYILVVMCSNVTDTNQVINDIVEISKKVYGVDSETITSDEDVKTTINSKVIDLKYIPEEKFDEMIENDDQSVLEYYTLDGNWKLITAKWSYTTTDGIKLSKNSAVNYRTTLQKYTTPFEYMLDYYIDMTDDDWINDFIDVAMKSEFIIAVQDNVTTREDNVTTTLEYMDGFVASSNSGIEVTETVSDTIELTYGDTWFVKFSKKDSYEAAALQSTTVATDSGANVTGDKGALVGNYSTTSYCYTCNDVGGNFGTNIGNHDNVLIPNFSIAVHSYDPNLKTGDYVWIEGNIYRVDDFGTGKAGNWLDVYVEPQSDIRGPCCGNSEWAERYNVPVYRATNIREKTAADTEATTTKDGTKLINTVADLKGKVTDTKSVTTTWQAGPVREVRREEGTYYIGSIFTIVTNTRNIAYKYVTGDYEVTGNEDKFIKLFEDNPGSEQLLKPEWLLENIEAGDRTAQFLDLTKYLLYKLTGYDYGVKEFDFVEKYTPDDFASSTNGLYGGSFEERIWFALLDAGFSKIAAAGAMGNFYAESGIIANRVQGDYSQSNPEAYRENYTKQVDSGEISESEFVNGGPGGGGYGLAQWTSSGRKQGLYSYAKSLNVSIGDEDMQINYLLGELISGKNPYASYQLMTYNGYSPNDWINAQTVEEATIAFCWSFERPGKPHMDARIEAAQKYYDEFKDKERLDGDSRIGPITLSGEDARKMTAMLTEALRIADDDRYYYSQPQRFGEFSYDCSSLVLRLYDEFFGITMPNTTYDYTSQYLVGNDGEVELQPGDVLWKSTHVGIYIGNNQLVEAKGVAYRNSC